jgi:Sodium/hydrogen exchanger family
VKLLIGILFVLISASVSPSTVRSLLPGGIALLAIMVFVLRPLTVLLATRGSTLRTPERAFIAWLAPRGIVAAATASAFGPTLAQAGIPGANKILPIAFIIIFGTVAIYGLSATPVARRLGLLAADSFVVLIVGGHEWARAIASALKEAGLRVRLWTGQETEQAQAHESGLDAGHGRLGVDFAAREAELEEVTDALLMTPSDNFNALAAYELRQELGNEHVFRLPPSTELIDLVPAYAEGELMFGPDLTYGALERRFAAGARIIAEHRRHDDQRAVPSSRARLLAVVSGKGELRVATSAEAPNPAPDDTGIWLV